MTKRINNKGFTLIELLAVLVILIAIMGIAIPSISSSLERTKTKQNSSREKVIVSAAELYVTDHKNAIFNQLDNSDSCYILVGNLSDYLSTDEMKDSDGNDLSGYYVIFNRSDNSYQYSETSVSNSCL